MKKQNKKESEKQIEFFQECKKLNKKKEEFLQSAVNYEIGMENFQNWLVEIGYLTKDFEETEENRDLKSQYIKAVMIYDDLSIYNKGFCVERDNIDSVWKMYQATKNSFLPLALLWANINNWGKYYRNDEAMIKLQKKIRPGLEFANHVRNKITAHIESDVINNSVQWEPFIFHNDIKNKESDQQIRIYKSILESSINSYTCPQTGKHKIFKKEIDIFNHETCNEFYTYMIKLIKNSLKYLDKLKNKINSQIIYFDGSPANLIKEAAATNFETKKKGR